MKRTSEIKHNQKKGIVPRNCPNCKSSRLEVIANHIRDEDGYSLRGFKCLKCGYKNARRLI